MKLGVLEHYRDYLPVTSQTPVFSIGEGDTPLVRCDRLAEKYGCRELYFKLEGCHPTGSFKDRGMVMAVAKAMEAGSRAIICASTGNTSASASAFAAYCGLGCVIIIPKGNISLGKLAQAIVYGARIVAIDGNFDEALNMVRAITEKHPVTLVNSLNPFRIEGQKTAAFEIIDSLGDIPYYAEGLVKIAVNSDYFSTVNNGLGQLAQGDISFGYDNKTTQSTVSRKSSG